MPLYLEDMEAERKPLKVIHGKHTVNFSYNPNDMTAATMRRFNKIRKQISADEEVEQDDLLWLHQTAELMIADWDLYTSREAEKAGDPPWEITVEHLEQLPTELVAKMVQLIFEDINPPDDPKSSGGNSDATSGARTSTPRRPAKR